MMNTKFRIWNGKKREFVFDFGLLFIDGSVFEVISAKDGSKLENTEEFCVVQQFTGLKDKMGRDCYCGDIVGFKYFVGDMAWEEMTDEEIKKNQEMVAKDYVGEVRWNETSASFEILVGDIKSTHLIFPAMYISNAEVISNIFQR